MADSILLAPLTPARPRLAVQDFLAAYDPAQHPVQLIDGEVVFLAMAKALHQYIVVRLIVLIDAVLAANRLGQVVTAPADLYLDDHNYYQPDVFFVAQTNLRCFVNPKGVWQGPPDLVAEVLSPSTVNHDRIQKFETYEQHGVREYWIIDPEARLVEAYTLSADGIYQRRAYGKQDSFTSHVLPALTITVAQLFPPSGD
jgi:Uma2 family endonuclease